MDGLDLLGSGGRSSSLDNYFRPGSLLEWGDCETGLTKPRLLVLQNTTQKNLIVQFSSSNPKEVLVFLTALVSFLTVLIFLTENSFLAVLLVFRTELVLFLTVQIFLTENSFLAVL